MKANLDMLAFVMPIWVDDLVLMTVIDFIDIFVN